jgi:methylglutaconyl-CoA hydratase
MTDTPSTLLTTLENGLLTLTLNRPEKRNALDQATIALLHAALERADLDTGVRVVAIRGAGKDFCAGLDLGELLASADKTSDENERAAMQLGSLFLGLRELPKPVVAVTHGRTLAGGLGLAPACDLVLAPESGSYGYPEIQRGFVPAMVMTLLRRLVGEKIAFDLVATGRMVAAAEAYRIGLVSRVMADDGYQDEVVALLGRMTATSASALALTKRQFYQLDGMPFEEGIRLGARVNATARTTPDFRAAIAAFLDKK